MPTIVVGVDGSENSRTAIDAAIAEAQWRGGDVRFVHVTRFPVAFGYPNVPIDPMILREEGARLIEAELSAAAERYGGALPVEVSSLVVEGHVGSQLVDAAADAELLVLGTRGMGGVKAMLIGSTTTYCVHHLPCQMLVVPGDA